MALVPIEGDQQALALAIGLLAETANQILVAWSSTACIGVAVPERFITQSGKRLSSSTRFCQASRYPASVLCNSFKRYSPSLSAATASELAAAPSSSAFIRLRMSRIAFSLASG